MNQRLGDNVLLLLFISLLAACGTKNVPRSGNPVVAEELSVQEKIDDIHSGEKIIIVLTDDSGFGMVFSHSDDTNLYGNIYASVAGYGPAEYFWNTASLDPSELDAFPVEKISRIVLASNLDELEGETWGKSPPRNRITGGEVLKGVAQVTICLIMLSVVGTC